MWRNTVVRVARVLSVSAAMAAAAAGAVLLVRAFDARRLPDLQPCHNIRFRNEFHVDTCPEVNTWHEYLEREAAAFAELEARLVRPTELSDTQTRVPSRFDPASSSYPGIGGANWNRSFEMEPADPWGAIVLLHGLTDSPYSVRAIAEIAQQEGLLVVAPRMPGHGLAPSALLDTTWQDWLAVLRMAVRHARTSIGPGRPLLLGGYSNGGALAVKYAVEFLDNSEMESPKCLYLFSPAIGVTRFAALASWHRALAAVPVFEKFRWESVLPEYDPFKYQSFPKIAGHQTWALTRRLRKDLKAARDSGSFARMPPMLVFQSLADSTVLTASVFDDLLAPLAPPESELVLFDINRYGRLDDLVSANLDRMLRRIMADAHTCKLTLITNSDESSREVVARTRIPSSDEVREERLGLEWPKQTYSLSHVSIPFSPEDAVYGNGDTEDERVLTLGNLAPHGEIGVLRIPLTHFMRLRYNPFHAYVEKRFRESLAAQRREGH